MARIVHLITGLGSGGAERMLFNLATAPQSRHEHVVVSMTGDGVYGPRLRDAGVKVHDLGMTRGAASVRAVFVLRRLLRDLRPDILQTWMPHADLLGLVAGKMAGVPRIAWNIRCSNMDRERYARLRWILARLSPMVDVAVVNSYVGKDVHRGYGYRPKRWTDIPNGFDLSRFRPDTTARERLVRELEVDGGTLLMGMVARLDPMKDHAGLLDAFERYRGRGGNANLVLVGRGCEAGGALASMIPASVRDNVRFLGERDDVDAVTAGLDVLVLSSAYGEGFPNVIGEAMASGVAVVATDCGDSARVVGDAGEVVPPRDPQALAEALGRMDALGPTGRAALGGRGRARIERDFDIGLIVERYDALYDNLAGDV